MKIDYNEIYKYSEVVSEYLINNKVLPIKKFRIKIYKDKDELYLAFSNLVKKDDFGGYDGVCGYGDSESEALDSLLCNFLDQIEENNLQNEQDFTWADPEYF